MRNILRSVLIITLILALTLQIKANNNLGPSGVHIAYLGTPTKGFSVVWQTYYYSQSFIEYGDFNNMMFAQGITIKSNISNVYIHKVILTNLEPGKTYYYRVGDPSLSMSEFFNFTVPAMNITEFNFTAWGDQGIYGVASDAVRIAVSLKPSFHLHLGDLTYSKGNETVWNKWFDLIEPLASHVPYFPAVGNHEYEGDPRLKNFFLARFSLPGDGENYYFIWGGALFITVNLGPRYWNPDNEINNTIQAAANWLNRTLSSLKDNFTWKILFLHYPILEVPILRNLIQPIIDKYKIDLILSGHFHFYARSYPVRGSDIYINGQNSYTAETGTIYVISGGAGAPLYNPSSLNSPWVAKKLEENNLLFVTVTKSHIKVKAISIPLRNVIDDFEILKTTSTKITSPTNITQSILQNITSLNTILFITITAITAISILLWLIRRK